MAISISKAGDIAADLLTDFIMLFGFIATDGNVTHLRQPFTTVGYQVTAGKTLYITRMRVLAQTNPGWWKLGYADNDVGFNTATARTNPVMAIGIDDTGNNGVNMASASNATSLAPYDTPSMLWKLSIAGKFPFLRRVGAVPNDTVMLWCVEI